MSEVHTGWFAKPEEAGDRLMVDWFPVPASFGTHAPRCADSSTSVALEAIASLARAGTFSLARVELDGIDELQELHGPHATESLVQMVAALLGPIFRSTDLFLRWEHGGFIVVFPNTSRAGAVRAIEKALQAVRGEHFLVLGSGAHALTASAGVMERSADPSPIYPSVFVEEAEHHLALARAAGGGRIHSAAGEVIPAAATILLLDDDPVSSGVIRHRLERKSHRVFHLVDGHDAAGKMRLEPISLVILNLNMGGLGGVGAVRQIRQMPEFRKVPIVVLSKVESEDDLVRCFQMGANDFVQKPFSVTELTSRVQRLLRAS